MNDHTPTDNHKIHKLKIRRPFSFKKGLPFVVTFGVIGTAVLINSFAATPRVELITSAAEYNRREDIYIQAVLGVGSASTAWPGLDATKGVALIDQAERTGNMSRIAEANNYMNIEINKINANSNTWEGSLSHGGPLSLITAYLRYKDKPTMLYPATRDRLKTEMRVYRDKMFNSYTSDNLNFDIATYNPWNPRPAGNTAYNGTENHKLSVITVAMLMTEMYAGETHRGYPVKDNTEARDDYWHYFRDAFMRYSDKWPSGWPTDHFGTDVNGVEKDSSQYTRVYVTNYWLIRDLFSDPVIKKHAEILLDRTLIDMAEDTVMGMYTGSAGRYYTQNPTEGINQNIHILNYLLFDNLGYTLPDDHAHIWGFGTWGYANMIASDYNPTHPDFPKAIVELAVNKENGYLTRNGYDRQANWVEKDFSLGFRVNGVVFGEGNSGGFYVYNKLSRGAGLQLHPFYGDVPFVKARPQQQFSGVVDRRVALVRDYNPSAQLKLWIKNGFNTVENSGLWTFISQPSSAGRIVYMAVRPATGTNVAGATITTSGQQGSVRVLSGKADPLIWEVSTSQEHASFEAFKTDVQNNTLSVTADRITYASSETGTTLSYDRANHTAHQVNGTPVNWADYNHGFRTPWSTNAYGSHEARLNKGGYSVTYDWDPDNDGNFDEMPSKVVNNDDSQLTAIEAESGTLQNATKIQDPTASGGEAIKF